MELKKYEKNISSQWGEDGVIEEIFNRIGPANKFCVEFGAWDGKHMSNCWSLWHEKDWSSFLIESVEERCTELNKTLENFPKVRAVNEFVKRSGESTLDKILDKYEVVDEIDLLSIDIDSDDYWVMEGLKRTPRVIIIEYNPTIPPHIELVQKEGSYIGSSSLSIVKMANKKGYKLAHLTFTNLIFVRNDEFDKLGFEELELKQVFQYEKLTCIITSYDGQTLLSQPMPYSQYIEPIDKGLRNYFKKKYFSKEKNDKVGTPQFDSNTELISCKVVKDNLI